MAEKTIKSDLTRRGVLLAHDNFASLARVAQKAIKKAIRWKRPIYVSPGLLTSPNWSDQYSINGFASPGIRWGNFKPDLLRFEAMHEGSRKRADEESSKPLVSFEVIEIKYRPPGGARDTIYQSWRCQAFYCKSTND
jgi:hypothetical protein